MDKLPGENEVNKGPCLQWARKIPKKFSGTDKLGNRFELTGNELEMYLGRCLFAKDGSYIICGDCLNHYPEQSRIETRTGAMFTYGRIGEHIRHNEKHALSMLAMRRHDKKQKSSQSNGEPTKPMKKQKLISELFSEMAKKETFDDSLTSVVTTTTSISKNQDDKEVYENTVSTQMQRSAILRSMSVKEQLNALDNVCRGIMSKSDLLNKTLQKGLYYTAEYYKGLADASHVIRPIAHDVNIYSVYSVSCQSKM